MNMAESVAIKIKTARDSGYDDDEIVEFLGKTDGRVAKAKEAGYRGSEILKFIETGKGYDRSGGALLAGLRGVYKGLGDVISAPGDLLGAGLDAIGVDGASGAGSRTTARLFKAAGRGAQALLGGDLGEKAYWYDRRSDLPPEERPFAAAGEVVGSSLPFAVAPLVAGARMAPSALAAPKAPPGVVGNIVQTAGRNPGTFAAVEAGGIGGAAQGAGVAEALFPDNPVAAFVGEAGGALLNPAGTLARGARGSYRSVKNAASTFSPSGRERRAAEYIQEIVRDIGEDPDALARALRQEDFLDLNITSGQKTGSPALLALEAKMGEKSARFRSDTAEKGTAALSELRKAADALASTGSPEALKAAGITRQRYFDRLLDKRLRVAEASAIEARLRMGDGTKGDSGAVSKNAYKILDDALTGARNVERELWGKVPRGERINTKATQDAYAQARSDLLPTETLQNPVEAYVRTLAGRNDVTVGDMLTLRSRALTLAREARSKGDWTSNRSMMTIADGVLDDLSEVPGGTADAARQFSRSLHDRFSRTFAGEALADNASGASRIPPEIMLERAFGAGGTKGDVRFREMGEAAAFPEGSSFGPQMLSTQEKFLRIAAQNSIDPSTGRVNADRLQRFLTNNESVLERFPSLRGQLSDAANAERMLADISKANLKASRAIQQRAVFSKLVDNEDPSRVVGDVLRGNNPSREYAQLVRLAKSSGEGAVGGLRAATIDHALNRAVSQTGQFSFPAIREALMRPTGRTGLSPFELMRRSGIVNARQAEQLKTIIGRAETLDDALKSGKRIDQTIGEPDALTDLVVRIAGARLGSQGAAGATGSSLIAAQRGSAFARNLFQKIPATRINDVIIEALNNPKMMAAFLEKPTSIGRKRQIDQQINAALLQSGLIQEEE